jgi:hypothetical protein
MSEQPTIHIKSRPWGGFSVAAKPLPEGVSEACCTGDFPTHRDAYGFAAGLRMTHGWPVQDHSGEASNG